MRHSRYCLRWNSSIGRFVAEWMNWNKVMTGYGRIETTEKNRQVLKKSVKKFNSAVAAAAAYA